MPDMSDAELVREALQGRMSAYEELVGRWSARVLATCHARVSNRHAAEDLAQEALLRGLRGLETIQEPEKFGPWLRGIASRVCLDWLKSKSNSNVPFSSMPSGARPETFLMVETESNGSRLEQAEQFQQLMAEVETLPEDFREVLMLYYYDDVTYRDLAEMLGVSAATVNARLTKARAMLRTRLAAVRR